MILEELSAEAAADGLSRRGSPDACPRIRPETANRLRSLLPPVGADSKRSGHLNHDLGFPAGEVLQIRRG